MRKRRRGRTRRRKRRRRMRGKKYVRTDKLQFLSAIFF